MPTMHCISPAEMATEENNIQGGAQTSLARLTQQLLSAADLLDGLGLPDHVLEGREVELHPGVPRVISDCRFRKTATGYDRKLGVKWLSCTEK